MGEGREPPTPSSELLKALQDCVVQVKVETFCLKTGVSVSSSLVFHMPSTKPCLLNCTPSLYFSIFSIGLFSVV